MRKMKKTICSFISILMIAAFMVTGCSSDNGPTNSPADNTTVNNSTSGNNSSTSGTSDNTQPTVVPITVEAPVFNYNDASLYATNDVLKVALSCPTPDAQLFWSIDGGSTYEIYTTPIRINQDTTINAYAELSGVQSSVTVASYKVAYAGTDLLDYTEDVENARPVYSGSDYTFKNWDDHLICNFGAYDDGSGYFVVDYDSLGSDPQLSFAYVKGSDWHEVYNCIALSNEAHQLVIPFNGGEVKEALSNEIHLMGQQVSIFGVFYVPDTEINYSAIEGGSDDPGFMQGVRFADLDAFDTWYEDGNLDGCSLTLNSDGTWSLYSYGATLEGTFVGFGAAAELYTNDGLSFATASPRNNELYLDIWAADGYFYFNAQAGAVLFLKGDDSEHKDTAYVADYDPNEYFIGTWLCYDSENDTLYDYGFELLTDGTYIDYPADSFSRPYEFTVEGEAIWVLDDEGNITHTFYFNDTIEPRCLVSEDETVFFGN